MQIQAKIINIRQTYHNWLHDNMPRIVRQVELEADDLGNIPAVVSELARHSHLHTQQEDEVLFPLLSNIENDPDPESLGRTAAVTLPIMDRMIYDHHTLQDLLARIRSCAEALGAELESGKAGAMLEELDAQFEDHMAAEDNDLFPMVRNHFAQAARQCGLPQPR